MEQELEGMFAILEQKKTAIRSVVKNGPGRRKCPPLPIRTESDVAFFEIPAENEEDETFNDSKSSRREHGK